MSQMDLFQAPIVPGWYHVDCQTNTSGWHSYHWHDDPEDLLQRVDAWVASAKARGEKIRRAEAKYERTPPFWARVRSKAWEYAASGAEVMTRNGGVFYVNGNELLERDV